MWVEVGDRVHRPRLQGLKGVSTSLHSRLILQINQLYRVWSYSRTYEQEYCLFGASHSFIAASCVNVLGLKVESLGKPLHVNSPLGTRVSVDMIFYDCEFEISGILLTVDLG